MSSHFMSYHITSCHVTSRRTSKRHDVLGSNDQRLDVGHERHDVAGFSSDGKLVKIQSLGLLFTSKLFLVHINHPRSSHDHI